MKAYATGHAKSILWYKHPSFSLVPQYYVSPASKYNTARFSFCWLFFRLWTLDTFSFEIAFVCNTLWGIGLIGALPYLRWNLVIPCPMWLEAIVRRYLHRQPKYSDRL